MMIEHEMVNTFHLFKTHNILHFIITPLRLLCIVCLHSLHIEHTNVKLQKLKSIQMFIEINIVGSV